MDENPPSQVQQPKADQSKNVAFITRFRSKKMHYNKMSINRFFSDYVSTQ